MKFVLAISVFLFVQAAKAVCEKPNIKDFEYVCPEFSNIYNKTTNTESVRLMGLAEEDRTKESIAMWKVTNRKIGIRTEQVEPTFFGRSNYKFTSCIEIYKLKLEEYKICLQENEATCPQGN